MRPPFETFKNPICRGSYALGSACGKCERCEWERGQQQNGPFGKILAEITSPPSPDRPEYEPAASCEMGLSNMAVTQAMSVCGLRPPTLFVHPDWVGPARSLAMQMGINFEVDTALEDAEWYVEWQGKRAGSLGR